MKRLLFFINPNAGHAEIRSSLMEVLAIFCKGGYEPTVHMTTGPRDITRQIAARGTQYDLIVCTGGDGTLNEAVSGLMELPYETPQEDKRIWGRLAYIMNGAGALGRLKPTHVRVYYEDRMEEADVLVGLVTSTTSVGGFKATKDLGISLNDGLYEMILVRATKTLAEFNLAATRALRLDFENDSFISAQTGALRFEFDEPVSWTVDGEFGGSVTEVEIHNEHRAIDIVVP